MKLKIIAGFVWGLALGIGLLTWNYTSARLYNPTALGSLSENLLPSADNAYNIGSPSLRWANLWVVSSTFSQITVPLAGSILETLNVSNAGHSATTTITSNQIGINSSSPIASLALKAVSTRNPFAINSSSASSMFTVLTNGNVGINTSSPQAMLSVRGSGNNSTTFSFRALNTSSTPMLTVDDAGNLFTLNNGFYYEASSSISYVNSLSTGPLLFPDDAGIVSWVDMTLVSSTMAAGTQFSYSANLNAIPMLTVYGEANGSGSHQNLRVGINSSSPRSLFSIQGRSTSNLLQINSSTGDVMVMLDQLNRFGIGTSSPVARFSVSDSVTTTIFLDSVGSKGTCLVLKDADGSGYTFVVANNGALEASANDCR